MFRCSNIQWADEVKFGRLTQNGCPGTANGTNQAYDHYYASSCATNTADALLVIEKDISFQDDTSYPHSG